MVVCGSVEASEVCNKVAKNHSLEGNVKRIANVKSLTCFGLHFRTLVELGLRPAIDYFVNL